MVFQLYDLDVIAAVESTKNCKNSWGIVAEQQGHLSCSFVPTSISGPKSNFFWCLMVIVFFGEEKTGYPAIAIAIHSHTLLNAFFKAHSTISNRSSAVQLFASGCRAAEAELSECQAQMRAGEMAMSWENSDFEIGFHKLLGFWNNQTNQTNQTSKESYIIIIISQHCDFHAFSILFHCSVFRCLLVLYFRLADNLWFMSPTAE